MNKEKTHINYIEFKAKKQKRSTLQFLVGFLQIMAMVILPFLKVALRVGFELTQEPIVNGALVVLHHHNLKTIKENIIKVGAKISIDIFSFQGGSRFHFLDPPGNELAVWCEE